MTRRSALAGLVLTLLGLGDSIYLAYEHATANATLACSGGAAVDCAKVTTSSYSSLAGIPVAYLGVAFFVAALGLAVMTLAGSTRMAAYAENLRLAASAVGVAMVAYLIWAEVQVGAICLWCTGVHVVTLALFVLSLFVVVLRDPSDT
jgi:uncharacterized membrane protein